MNAFQTRVLIGLFVKIELVVSPASASQVLLVSCAKETSMSASADPVGMERHAEMVSTASGEKQMIDVIQCGKSDMLWCFSILRFQQGNCQPDPISMVPLCILKEIFKGKKINPDVLTLKKSKIDGKENMQSLKCRHGRTAMVLILTFQKKSIFSSFRGLSCVPLEA